MADIAREARVSYGLAYHYFRSKDALFAELVRLAYEGSYGLFVRAKGAPGARQIGFAQWWRGSSVPGSRATAHCISRS